MFFLGILYRLIFFFTAHEALLAGLSTEIYFYIKAAMGVTGGT